ncbi:GntR family transcriptional regulator [Agromyces laixinhei]|uniref:GntR family transcriptional regulator n=1 Tax=Agromyces laixinhei TaxID=2585717 RepID=UPI001F1F00D7|nr:GntR family transcriptional regulator [Agromyces laixinhei]
MPTSSTGDVGGVGDVGEGGETPVTPSTAVDRVAASLRAEILSGALAPGAPLREEAGAERYAVSRHTVRAAFQRLVAERLIVAEAYRGVRVASFGRDEVIALQQLRAALEVEAVRIAGERYGDAWPDDVLAPARSALDRLDALAGASRNAAPGAPPDAAPDAPPDAPPGAAPDAAPGAARRRTVVVSEATDSHPPTRQPSSDGGRGGVRGRRSWGGRGGVRPDGGRGGVRSDGGWGGTGGDADEWLEVERLHADFHHAIVMASASPRIIEAHAALGTELLLFLLHVRPHYSLDALIEEHRALLDELPTRGGSAVREHLEHSTRLLTGT